MQGRIKRDKLDILFSKIIRERADWKCESCGKDLKDNPGGLHCSHIHSRRHRLIRWCKANAVAHCIGCHRKLGESPIEFADWARGRKGRLQLAKVEKLKHEMRKLTKADKEDIYKWLKRQYDCMLKSRGEGKTGWLDYDCPQYNPGVLLIGEQNDS